MQWPAPTFFDLGNRDQPCDKGSRRWLWLGKASYTDREDGLGERKGATTCSNAQTPVYLAFQRQLPLSGRGKLGCDLVWSYLSPHGHRLSPLRLSVVESPKLRSDQ